MITAVIASERASSCHRTVWTRPSKVGIVQDHRHRGMHQDEGAEVQEGREAAEQPRHELAAEEDDRDREQQTEHEQADVAVRRAGDRQDVVETHDDVGEDDRLDRLP